ncbi:MAG: hypothetical protein ACKOD3_07600 [Phenylobacterium sp.]
MTVRSELRLSGPWEVLLQATLAGLAVMGLVLLLTPSIGEMFFYVVYFGALQPPEPFSEEARGYIRFAHGVLGAMMLGWMVLIHRLARISADGPPASNWSLIRISIGTWFVIDTTFSIVHGVYGNVLLNLACAIGILVPLHFGLRAPAKPEPRPD